MTKTADEVVIGANGSVYTAPVGTSGPVSSVDVLDAAWTELGYTSEDGVTLTDGKEIFDVGAWQSFYPIRSGVSARNLTAAFVLRQWNEDTIVLAFGGGSVEDLGSGEYQYHPPSAEDLGEIALLIEWADGDKHYRVHLPKGLVTEDVAIQVARTQAADLPITFGLRPTGVGDAWEFFSDDPALAS